MKISVVADRSGKILGALIPSTSQNGRANSLRLKASESRFVHEADLPNELVPHIGKETFAMELLKYSAKKTGGRVMLRRA